MWTRIQLKDKAKKSLDKNYWKIILVSLIVVFVGGGSTYQMTNTVESDFESTFESEDEDILNDLFSESDDITNDDDYQIFEDENEYDDDLAYSELYEDPNASDEYWEGYYDGYFGNSEASKTEDYLAGYNDGQLDDYVENDFGSSFEDGFSSGDAEGISTAQIAGIVIIVLVVVFIVLIIATAIGMVYGALIINPVDVGTKRFFVKSLNEKAEVKEVAYAFDNNYKNVIKILFIRDIKILLWSLLFIIPGMVKSYEYLMIPYLLAENPNLTKEEAFRLSKQMMTGQKWNAFVLHLSFFWWDMLSIITAGIVSIFYVQPYRNLTFAALYEELSAINGYPARAVAAQANMENPYVQAEYEAPEYTYTETTSTTENTYNSPE